MSMALTNGDHDEAVAAIPAAMLLAALGKPFPHGAIKQRPGGRGKGFTYVAGYTIIHRLNDATSGKWDWEIKSFDFRPLPPTATGKEQSLVVVTGTLTIPGLGSRSGVGVQVVVDGAGEDLVKGASTDALKKAATLFGVALELYGEDYEDEPAPLPEPTPMVKTTVEDWPDERLLAVFGQESPQEPQEVREVRERRERRAATIYLARATDRDTLVARLTALRKAGMAKDAAGPLGLARAAALGIPPKQPAVDDLIAVVGEPEVDPQTRRVALVWSVAAQLGWDEARVRAFGKQLYQTDDLGKWSAAQLDSFVTFMRAGNHAQAVG